MDSPGEEDFGGAEERPVQPERASSLERLAAAIPLVSVFCLIALAARLAPRFQNLYDEIGLSELPGLTHFWMTLFLHSAFPFVFGPFMFATAFVPFAWICRNRERMRWSARIVAILGFLLMAFLVISLFLPLIGTWEKIGGAR